uniref:nucleoside-diphosphate kinase n=1 Tax=Pseudodiaptomus poplesia TaxID=213370 RepID=A0A0U2LG48_9MAXI|nr:nucleoside diphosphate kinase A 1 [Pseudodiaptomus poplesia]
MSNTERTFIMIKPDGVHRGIVGEIIKRFEQKGYKLVAMKFMQASVEHLEKHYAVLAKKPFFPGLVKYMASGPVVAMVWEGLNAVKTGRVMLGETNPGDSKPHHQGRFLCPGWTQHLPRLRRCRVGREGDRLVVQARGARQLDHRPGSLDLRVTCLGPNCRLGRRFYQQKRTRLGQTFN